MKWNFFLLVTSFFSVIKSGLDPIRPSVNTAAINLKLKKFNVSLNPLVVASPGLIEDTWLNPMEKEIQVLDTTQNLLLTLKNPTVFCTLVYILQKIACDESKTFVPLKVEVGTTELMRGDGEFAGGYIYVNGSAHRIIVTTTYKIKNIIQRYVIRHELRHGFWNVHNLAECTKPDASRIKKHFSNSNLPFDELRSAPYDSTTKALFRNSLFQGIKQLVELKKISTDMLTATASESPHASFKKTLDCYEKEAAKVPLTQLFSRSDPLSNSTPLTRVLTRFEEEIELTMKKYKSSSTLEYELDAAIYGVLTDYPALFNDNFKKINKKVSNIHEYAKCVNQLDPLRSTSTCKK